MSSIYDWWNDVVCKALNAVKFLFLNVYDTDETVFVWHEGSGTGTVELAPAPGAGNQYIVSYGSIRTESNNGDLHISNGASGVDEVKAFKIFASTFTKFSAGNVRVPMGDNKPINLVSNVAGNYYVAVNYHLEPC